MRHTGGLVDTVRDATQPDGTGFVFQGAGPGELLAAVRRAQQLWQDKEQWRRLQRRGMACDFSWATAAAAYEELYGTAGKQEVR